MIKYITADYLFSYWIFAWFIIFILFIKTKIVNNKQKEFIKTYFNPRFALIIALFENIALFIYFVFHNAKNYILFKYIFMIFFFKIIPFILLRKEKVRWCNEISITIVIFILYCVYLELNHIHLHDVIQETSINILSNTNNTPFFRLLQTISSIYKKFNI